MSDENREDRWSDRRKFSSVFFFLLLSFDLALLPVGRKTYRKKKKPQQYGADKDVKNAIHGSKSIMDARNEIEFFFDRKWPTTAIFNNCTCAVIRPHAIKDTGDIIDRILSFDAANFQAR